MSLSRLPVIVGVGQITDTTSDLTSARSPLDLMRDAARLAILDSRADEHALASIDSLAVVRLFSDSLPRFESPFGKVVDPPSSLARRLGASPSDLLYSAVGGDSPQRLVSRAFARISSGLSDSALVVGAEALRTELMAKRAGVLLDWAEDAIGESIQEPSKELYTASEESHGMRSAIAMYALIGQAWRGARKMSLAAYQRACSEICTRLEEVARGNRLAARRDSAQAGDYSHMMPANPYVGFPYTKQMVASAYNDQAAAILIVSSDKADELGIPSNRRVYLHGAANAHDTWFVSHRTELHRSPAMRATGARALDQAGLEIKDLSYFDLYSCFPSAVQIARQELDLPDDDPRGITVTGGLPFFGGPGNNYSTHAIAEMVQRVRTDSGSFGFVGANGGLLTKQAAGIYSTTVPTEPLNFEQIDLGGIAGSDAEAKLKQIAKGLATVETYTVLHDKNGPKTGLVFGRLISTGERFLANTAIDEKTLRAMECEEWLGRLGTVSPSSGSNVFSVN